MFHKLAFRNVLRSARDYLVYFLTMLLVTAIMFAFHSLIFSEDLQKLFKIAMIMASLIGIADFFVVLIIAWLIHYMVQFILKKRSREFGIYLLIGMSRRDITRLYLRESLLLGAGAFLGGLPLGMLLQQILMAILYSCIRMEYRVRLEWNTGCLLTTAACCGGCYLLALFRCRRRFRKMNILALMNCQRQNEEIKESHEEAKRWLLPLSLLALLFLGWMLFFYTAWDMKTIIGFLAGLIAAIYLFYFGISAWIICYIRKKGKGIFKGQNLFLLRQFSSKVKALRFTLGTLTSLFVLALLGCGVSMMLNDYQTQILMEKWPFDVQIFSHDTEEDFHRELEVLYREARVRETIVYPVYQNGTHTVNTWLYTHLKTFGSSYLKEDGTPDMDKIENQEYWAYYPLDTYMALSDYNRLRELLSLPPAELARDQYALHLKERVWKETGDFTSQITLAGPEGPLTCNRIYTEPFAQDGHNGADYLIIVPDSTAESMTPFYKLLAADLEDTAPETLLLQLDALWAQEEKPESEAAPEIDSAGHVEDAFMASGTDNIVVYVCKNLVRDNLIPEVKFMLSSLIFSLVYIGLIFVCVALTVLSVQQLSDSAGYRFRYQVLGQIGLGRREICGVILKQLAGFYLCPILFAAAIAGTISVYIGWQFNFHTGTRTPAAGYFGISFLLFLAIYGVYFAVTYTGFLRNVLTPPETAG